MILCWHVWSHSLARHSESFLLSLYRFVNKQKHSKQKPNFSNIRFFSLFYSPHTLIHRNHCHIIRRSTENHSPSFSRSYLHKKDIYCLFAVYNVLLQPSEVLLLWDVADLSFPCLRFFILMLWSIFSSFKSSLCYFSPKQNKRYRVSL